MTKRRIQVPRHARSVGMTAETCSLLSSANLPRTSIIYWSALYAVTERIWSRFGLAFRQQAVQCGESCVWLDCERCCAVENCKARLHHEICALQRAITVTGRLRRTRSCACACWTSRPCARPPPASCAASPTSPPNPCRSEQLVNPLLAPAMVCIVRPFGGT